MAASGAGDIAAGTNVWCYRDDAKVNWKPYSFQLKWFTEFGHLNRGDMLTSEQHRCHNEKKKFQR
ncbi:hypothetical protein, partial [Klebsiella pneumoniae]|uniref:hypothetical protein n=1 Tax=Klebsiella pneumoniae TaxID=573 RepID=UPI001B301743